MKGIMVPMLFVTMVAGMAQGQQQHADHGPPPFLLSLDDQRIENIRTNPLGEQTYLPPDVMGKVHEVIIRHKNFGVEATFQQGYWRAVPEEMQRKLVPFVISVTDEQLAHLKIDPDGLQSFLPEEGMSRVNQIIIRRVDIERNQAGDGRNNLRGAGIADSSNQDNGAFNPGNFSPRSPVTNRTPTQSENDFPVRGTTPNERSSISNIQPPFSNNNFPVRNQPVTDPNTRSPDQTKQDPWNFRNSDRDFGVEGQARPTQRQFVQPRNNNGAMTNQERIQYEMDLLERKRLENESLQLKNLRLQRQLAEQEEQNERDRLNELMRQRNRQMTDAQNGNRYATTDQNLPVGNQLQPIQNPTRTLPNRRSDVFTNVPVDNSVVAPNRQRTAMLPKPGVGGLSMSIPFPEKTNAADNSNNQEPTTLQAKSNNVTEKTNGLLWFMLFCSLGINLYLWWISRSFYVRYNELADELRETFTSSSV